MARPRSRRDPRAAPGPPSERGEPVRAETARAARRARERTRAAAGRRRRPHAGRPFLGPAAGRVPDRADPPVRPLRPGLSLRIRDGPRADRHAAADGDQAARPAARAPPEHAARRRADAHAERQHDRPLPAAHAGGRRRRGRDLDHRGRRHAALHLVAADGRDTRHRAGAGGRGRGLRPQHPQARATPSGNRRRSDTTSGRHPLGHQGDQGVPRRTPRRGRLRSATTCACSAAA